LKPHRTMPKSSPNPRTAPWSPSSMPRRSAPQRRRRAGCARRRRRPSPRHPRSFRHAERAYAHDWTDFLAFASGTATRRFRPPPRDPRPLRQSTRGTPQPGMHRARRCPRRRQPRPPIAEADAICTQGASRRVLAGSKSGLDPTRSRRRSPRVGRGGGWRRYGSSSTGRCARCALRR
jgi:hypothetical protein